MQAVGIIGEICVLTLRVFDINGNNLELLVKYECLPKLKVFRVNQKLELLVKYKCLSKLKGLHVNKKLELLVKYKCLSKLKGLHVNKELELWLVVSVSQSTGYMTSTKSFESLVR